MQANKVTAGNVLVLATTLVGVFLVGFLIFGASLPYAPGRSKSSAKPAPAEIIQLLKSGNERFCAGTPIYPHTDPARLALAAEADQANHATATVISCSDSRVPVELIFDAGIMDLFVIRVAGNVADTDEIGSIEYGLAHVKTPVLVVLGHTRCGAVSAVAQSLQGHGHKLERNIPPLVDNIVPAVKRAMDRHHGDALINFAVEENVWQSIEDLLMKSPAVRNMVKKGQVVVAGAVYDLASGKVQWLETAKVAEILGRVETSADKETEPFAH